MSLLPPFPQKFCPEHNRPYCLKTGGKPGASYGQSFYICTNRQCEKFVPAKGIDPVECPVHKKMVLLQSICKTSQGNIWLGKWHDSFFKTSKSDDLASLREHYLLGKNQSENKQPNGQSTSSDRTSSMEKSLGKLPLSQRGLDRATRLSGNSSNKVASSEGGSVTSTKDDESSKRGNLSSEGIPTDENTESCDEQLSSRKSDPKIVVEELTVHGSCEQLSQPELEGEGESEEASVVCISEQSASHSDSTVDEVSLAAVDHLRKIETAIKQVQCAMKPSIMTQLPDRGQGLVLKEAQLFSAKDALEKKALPEIVVVDEQQVASSDEKHKTKPTDVAQRVHPVYAAYMEQERRLYGGKMTDTRMMQVKAITKGAIQDLYHSLDSCPTAEETDPPGLTVPLMKHQREALAWLLWRETQRPPGGILADDMGLGKTLTMIALIMKDNGSKSHCETDLLATNGTLVVCPASVVMQWESEIRKRVQYGQLSVYVHHGQGRLKDPERLKHFDVVVTSYATLNSEGQNIKAEQQESGEQKGGRRKPRKKTSHCVLPRIHWHRVILDEGHTIKNHKTSTAASACILEANHRWILTGTPVQNDLLDMYSLIKFLRVAPFSELSIWKHHVSVQSRAGSQRLHILVKSLLLRRTKQEVIATTVGALPEKREQVHNLELSMLEAFAHWRLFSTARCFLATEVVKSEDTSCSVPVTAHLADDRFSHYDFGNLPQELKEVNKVLDEAVLCSMSQQAVSERRGQSSLLILTLILRLQQCCNHLSLLVANVSPACDTFDADMEIVDKMKSLQLDSSLDQPNPLEWPDCFLEKFVSTKIRCLVEEISQIIPSSKTVVVSQWTSMLHIVQVHLEKAGIRCDIIKGSMNPAERQRVVDCFNSDSKAVEVLLLSLRAGGCGLNLIGGNHLFLLDPHWNPALEQQACDRIYRLGQKRNVVIHKFICQKTIEEKLLLVQEKKKAIADRVLISGKPSSAANKLSIEDLRMLFDV